MGPEPLAKNHVAGINRATDSDRSSTQAGCAIAKVERVGDACGESRKRISPRTE